MILKSLKNIFIAETAVCVFCDRKRIVDNMPLASKGVGICSDCHKGLKFVKPGGSFMGSDSVSYVLSPLYYKNIARDIVKSLKFHDNTKLFNLVELILKDFISYYPHLSQYDLVIPVPLSDKRMNERGYNQSDAIAKIVSKYTDTDFCNTAVKRIRHTKKQSELPARKRLENVKNAFLSDNTIANKKIILVDDVRTTGKTMDSCAKALLDAGADEVIGFAFAISVPITGL